MRNKKTPYEILEITPENKVWCSHYENELNRTEAVKMAQYMARTFQPHNIGPITTHFAVSFSMPNGKCKIIAKFQIDSLSPE